MSVRQRMGAGILGLATTVGLLTLLAGAVSVLALASPAQADLPDEVNLGGVDVNAYCLAAGYTGGAVLHGSSASGWKCKDGNGNEHGISMTALCQYQFSDLVRAGYSVFDVRRGGAFGWRCHTFGTYTDAGGIDIDEYCRDQGFTGGAINEPDNVAGWRCVSNSGQFPVNLHEVCRFQHADEVNAGRVVVATYEDWGQAHGVNCYAF